MWWDHPFSQRNKTTERTVGVGVGGDREGGGSVTSRPKMMSVNCCGSSKKCLQNPKMIKRGFFMNF